MHRLHGVPYPALIPGAALTLGALVGLGVPAVLLPGCAIGLVAAWILALAAYERASAPGVAIAAALGFALAGATLTGHTEAAALATPLVHVLRKEPGLLGGRAPVHLLGRLREDAVAGIDGPSLTLEVTAVDVGRGLTPVRGGVRLSVGGAPEASTVVRWRAGRRVEAWALLREPGVYRNPGGAGSDEPARLARRGIALVGTVKSGRVVEVTSRGSLVAEASSGVRAFVRAAVSRHVGRRDARTAGVVTAILIGDRTGLEPDDERRLQEAGTYHVIAISGGNIAILAALLLGAFRAVRVSPQLAAVLTILGLLAYAGLVGPEPSVVRATVAAVAYLGARALDHRAPPLNALAAAAMLLVVASPLAIAEAGFGLSFGATLAIVMGVPAMLAAAEAWAAARGWRVPFGWRPSAGLLAATLSAELAVAPLGAWWFSRLTFAGIALNFVAVPLMSVVQVAGLAAVGLASVSERLADRAGDVAYLAVRGLVDSARAVEWAPWLVRRVPAPSPGLLAAYYAGWAIALAGRGFRPVRRLGWVVAGLASVALVTAPVLSSAGPRSGWLGAVFLDVGQGDAVVLRLPDGRALLVDAGGSPGGRFDLGGRIVAPALWALGVRRLETLIITHGDQDHIGGAAAIVRDFRPRAVWEGIPVPSLDARRALAAEPVVAHGEWRQVQAGDRVLLGAVELVTLHPPLPDWERQAVRNDDSVVLDVRYGRVSILLTGDIGREVEPLVSARLEPAALRIVKVPHHGSGSSSSAAWLAAAAPAAAVVSVGRGNLFNHPAPAALARYLKAGVEVWRTDRDGAVLVASDGSRVEISTWRGGRAGKWHLARVFTR